MEGRGQYGMEEMFSEMMASKNWGDQHDGWIIRDTLNSDRWCEQDSLSADFCSEGKG